MQIDLLKENITKSLLLFALPLIIGNMLQQLYNIADTFNVGQYISSAALAAVGASYSVMSFLTSIILGLCMGSGVLFSMLFGANNEKRLRNSFFISFITIASLSICLEIICLIFIDPILSFINIPKDIYAMTKSYFWIVFLGIFFTFIYNYFSSILRAIGDSRTPLLFLAISTILNIILDIILIVQFQLGVNGAAIATIFSQFISSLAIASYVIIKKKELLPNKDDCYFDKNIFNKIKDYSLLTCLQQSVMNFGILMIQGLVNSYGVVTMSAFSAAVKIDSFAYMPVQDFGNAFSTFIAQNKGANENQRIKKGLKSAIMISTIFCIIISLLVYFNAEKLMLIFIKANELEIIKQGVEYLQIEGTFYLGIGCLFLLYGFYRGIGKPGMSVILTIISLGTRVILAYALSPILGKTIIWLAIPIGWFLADLTGIVYTKKISEKSLI